MSATCVFCTRHEQPQPLFETAHLYAMPDKFPLRPGHILIIAKEHLRCYAMGPIDLLHELDAAAARVRRFLEDTYSVSILTAETGKVGQTVFHAHLHLVPLGIAALPAAIAAHPNVIPASDWRDVQDYFAAHDRYYYVELAERRYIFSSINSPALQMLREMVAARTAMRLDGQDFVKSTTPEDVAAVGRHWRSWMEYEAIRNRHR